MKLKKTLSMLIGGICLVAATSVAFAGPICYLCGGNSYATTSTYSQLARHNYMIGSRTYVCRYKVNYKRTKYRCAECGTIVSTRDTYTGESGHTCGMLY